MILKNSELDFLMYFYLIECGYIHTAFTFNFEANLNFLKNKSKNAPPGLLISLVQRGILYAQIESDFLTVKSKNFRSPIENFFFQKREPSEKKFYCFKNFQNPKKEFRLIKKNNFFIQCLVWHSRILGFFWATNDSPIFFIYWIKSKTSINYITKYFLCFRQNNQSFLKKNISALDMNLIGTLIAIGSFVGQFQIWSDSGKLLYEKNLIVGPVVSIQWSEKSDIIILGCLWGKLLIFSLWNMDVLFIISPFKDFLGGTLLLNNQKVSTFSEKKEILLLNIKKKQHFSSRSNFCKLNQLAFCSRENFLASCGEDRKIFIWILKKCFKLLKIMDGHKKEIVSMQWKPYFFNKKENIFFLVSASLDFSFKVWQLNKEKPMLTFFKNSPIVSVIWDFCGKNFLAGMIGRISKINQKNLKYKAEIILGDGGIFNMYTHSMLKIFSGFCNNLVFYF
jgi:transducin (beta)-like 1